MSGALLRRAHKDDSRTTSSVAGRFGSKPGFARADDIGTTARVSPLDTDDTSSRIEVPVTPDTAPQLHLLLKGSPGESRRMQCRRVVTLLGFHDACKVQLKHPNVDSVHVALINTGAKLIAVDLVTQYGTKLNGMKMEHETLRNGDVLFVDPWEFAIELRPPATPTDPAFQEPRLEPTPETIGLQHVASGQVFKLNREGCTIGRRSGCDITMTDPCVSRIHALLFFLDWHPVIIDLFSGNGLLVNGTPARFRRLAHKDIVTIGETEFRVHLVGMPGKADLSKGNGQSTRHIPSPDAPPVDLIDIRETESSQQWRIADHVDESTRKKP